MTKTCAAFRLSAESLWRGGCIVYMWTFTFHSVQNDWDGSKKFTRFLDHLRKVFRGCDWGGVKVGELHKFHGIHFHALIDRRLPVDIIRRVAQCYGIGRVHVFIARKDSAKYLAKYLSKTRSGPMCESGRFLRRWSSFGKIPGRVKISNLVNNSPCWVFRRSHGLQFLGFKVEHYLRRCWDHGEQNFLLAHRLAREGLMSDVIDIARGKVVARGDGCWAYRKTRYDWEQVRVRVQQDMVRNPF